MAKNMVRGAISILSVVAEAVLDRVNERMMNTRYLARVAINMPRTRSSWGGGNQWVNQITGFLRSSGYSVRFNLDELVDCIILVDSREGGRATFGLKDISVYKDQHTNVSCIHRINENDLRKDTSFIDRLLAKTNEVADYTVFISEWLRDYHAERWFDMKKPHTVIRNGADPRIYHAVGSAEFVPGGTMRLVTHHWSDNWRKGFGVYEEIDRLIAEGQLANTELWVIGRWPGEIRWKAARTFGPRQGVSLGRLLRSCHVYVTASLWEPGGMHFIEGAQCGLPLLYHVDGGGIVELGRKFGIGFRNDIRSAIVEVRERYAELRRAVQESSPSGDRMCSEYRQVIGGAIELKRNAR